MSSPARPSARSQAVVFAAALLLHTGLAFGQSSSLYVQPSERDAVTGPYGGDGRGRLAPAIAQSSLSAVRLPEPRQFALYDLVTIIIRESTESESESSLETGKEFDMRGELTAIPPIRLPELLELQLLGNSQLTNPPRLELGYQRDFEGEGEYSRKDTFIGRIQARIIDIKPNGNIVLEARKYIRSDEESLEIVLTGTCRKDDITLDNTILSTQLYDLSLAKRHSGEVRKSAKKGWLTELLEVLSPF